MTNNLRDIAWPALCFGKPHCAFTFPRNKDSFAYRFASERSLSALLRLSELTLIDSNGLRFDFHSPEYADSPANWWKIKSRLLGSTRPIQWKVVVRGKTTADQLKEIILSDFNEYESMWVEQYGFEELKSAIISATSIREIFDIFDQPPQPSDDEDDD